MMKKEAAGVLLDVHPLLVPPPLSDPLTCRMAGCGKCALPSPCATHTPIVEPSIPLSSTAGEGMIVTDEKRDSKRPESLWMKRGWAAGSSAALSRGLPSPEVRRAGTQPSRACVVVGVVVVVEVGVGVGVG